MREEHEPSIDQKAGSRIAASESRRAMHDAYEFIAEVYAMTLAGEKPPRGALRLYNKLNGPELPKKEAPQ
jgi:hypothetical protein